MDCHKRLRRLLAGPMRRLIVECFARPDGTASAGRLASYKKMKNHNQQKSSQRRNTLPQIHTHTPPYSRGRWAVAPPDRWGQRLSAVTNMQQPKPMISYTACRDIFVRAPAAALAPASPEHVEPTREHVERTRMQERTDCHARRKFGCPARPRAPLLHMYVRP